MSEEKQAKTKTRGRAKKTADKVVSQKAKKPEVEVVKSPVQSSEEVLGLSSVEVGQNIKTLDGLNEGEVISTKVVEGKLLKVKVRWTNGMSYVVSPSSIELA